MQVNGINVEKCTHEEVVSIYLFIIYSINPAYSVEISDLALIKGASDGLLKPVHHIHIKEMLLFFFAPWTSTVTNQ